MAEEADPVTALAAKAIGDAQALAAVFSMIGTLTEPQVLKHLDWICVATTEPQFRSILDTAVPAVEGDPETTLAAIAIADARALTVLSSVIHAAQSQRIVRTASSQVTITLGVRKIRGKQHRPAQQLKLSGRLIPGWIAFQFQLIAEHVLRDCVSIAWIQTMRGESVRFLVRFVASMATVDNIARRETEQDEGRGGGEGGSWWGCHRYMHIAIFID
jgi:hypothetical protein